MKFFTNVTIAATVATFFAAQAVAATTAPLAPGKPAGVKHAQMTEGWLIPLAIGAAAIGIVVAVSGNGNGNLVTAPAAAAGSHGYR